MTCSIVKADAIDFLRAQPEGSLDLVFGSPPYEEARLYLENGVNLGVSRKTPEWVAWMADVHEAAQKACKGLVAFVVAGQTRGFRWSAGPVLLMAELHKRGLNLRNPPIFHRVGIPGSGSFDWLRSDYEFIVCTTRPGRLPYSDNTAMGHPPKWAPGGEMSHRLSDGTRVNQWGHSLDSGATVVADDGVVRSKGKRPSHKMRRVAHEHGETPGEDPGIFGPIEPEPELPAYRNAHGVTTSTTRRRPDGKREKQNQTEINAANGKGKGRRVTRGHADGDTATSDSYDPPTLANPGNSIERTYTAAEVAALLQEHADWRHHKVGGGLMGGDQHSRQNEAPFPEALAEFFVLSFCPPGGLVCDVFSGSGTTAAVAIRHGRNFTGCDLRQSQVDLGNRRLAQETPLELFCDD